MSQQLEIVPLAFLTPQPSAASSQILEFTRAKFTRADVRQLNRYVDWLTAKDEAVKLWGSQVVGIRIAWERCCGYTAVGYDASGQEIEPPDDDDHSDRIRDFMDAVDTFGAKYAHLGRWISLSKGPEIRPGIEVE